MEGRRLDFDCKKRKGSKSMYSNCLDFIYLVFILLNIYISLSAVPPEEVRAAEDKFESSKTVCYNAMLTLSEGEVSC